MFPLSKQFGLCRAFNVRIVYGALCHRNLSTAGAGDDVSLADSLQASAPTQTSGVVQRSLPIMTSRKLAHMPVGVRPQQAWIETLSSVEDEKLGIIDLHPDIFGLPPRVDILWMNIDWQRWYRYVDYRHVNNRAEMRGGGRKPWPQKGTGRARHGSIRSPIFKGGGKVHGPRGPNSYFFMLPKPYRILGLQMALSVKYSQCDLHIVDSLDLPTDSPQYLLELMESRGWGLSVLFIDDTDIVSKNIALATQKIKQYNVMPVYGMNVYSMLKHETLVLTVSALERIEERLLSQVHSVDFRPVPFKVEKLRYF